MDFLFKNPWIPRIRVKARKNHQMIFSDLFIIGHQRYPAPAHWTQQLKLDQSIAAHRRLDYYISLADNRRDHSAPVPEASQNGKEMIKKDIPLVNNLHPHLGHVCKLMQIRQYF